MIDPLDAGKPTEKRWEEFRAQYSASLLTHWIIWDLAREAGDAVEDLWSRLSSSLYDYPDLMRKEAAEQGEDWDGYVPFHGREDTNITWFHVDDLAAVYDSLFPHDLKNASMEPGVWAGVIIGIHSALESYAKQLGIDLKKGLVQGVRSHMSAKGVVLDANLAEALDDFDATRHVIVHNRGCVDEAYIRRVRNSPFQPGERRVLTSQLVEEFSRTAFKTAKLLRAIDDPHAAV